MLPLRRVTASRVRSDLGYTLHVFEGVGSPFPKSSCGYMSHAYLLYSPLACGLRPGFPDNLIT